MSAYLGMEVTEMGEDFLTMRMPVDHRTVQPYGLLHGGASAALAENVGSQAGILSVEEGKVCVGLSINCNHIRAVRDGFIYGTARPIHLGKSTQLWEIRIVDEQDRLVCVSKLTLAVIDKQ